MAGDSTLVHSLGEREVHGDGYEILGKNTVEYSCIAPCLEGEHAFSEKEKWVDFWTRRESWCWSDRSVDFHTPRYLDGWRGGVDREFDEGGCCWVCDFWERPSDFYLLGMTVLVKLP